jgi:hypothetical protein
MRAVGCFPQLAKTGNLGTVKRVGAVLAGDGWQFRLWLRQPDNRFSPSDDPVF